MELGGLVHYVKASVEIMLEKQEEHSKAVTTMSHHNFTLMKPKQQCPQSGETSAEKEVKDSEEKAGGKSKEEVINEYETIIQKLENDVRNHIRNEQTLKLHIESI